MTRSGITESYAYDADGNRIKKVSNGVTTRTFFPGVYEEEQMTVSPYTTTAVKHYSFSGMRIAISKGGVLSYVHSDHLSSSSVETNSSGASTAARTYYAYGSTRSSSGTLQTDRTYTGQKQDGTGLLYYNARYYDSALGVFLSPDTLVPDAGQVVDYNRFLYVRGNPLSLNDPTGHETNKPDWWPPFLPYTFDLPDGISYEDFVEWAAENNIPTAISGQAGIDGGAGMFFEGILSIEVQGTVNWLSGEYMLSVNQSAGARLGAPVNGMGMRVGGTATYHASSTTILEDASLFAAMDGGVDIIAGAGLVGTYSRASEYFDTNGNGQFDFLNAKRGEGVSFTSIKDPIFRQPVESLSLDATVGINVTPTGLNGGASGGVKDTNRLIRIDLYAPFRWLFRQ